MKSSIRERNKTLCGVLHNAVIDLCREKYFPDSRDWEVDGIICISVPDSREQHIVKIHEKFPLESLRKLVDYSDGCYSCEKQRENIEEGCHGDSDRSSSYPENEERYRDVSVIDLEHALQSDNLGHTGQGHRLDQQSEAKGDNFRNQSSDYFSQKQHSGENVHQSSSRNSEMFDSGHEQHSVKGSSDTFSESFTNVPNEPLPPPPVDIRDEADYTIIKNEPSESEDFDLHMQCINEDYDPNVKKKVEKRDLEGENISYLMSSEHEPVSNSHHFDSSGRAWGPKKHPPPSSTVTIASDQSGVPTREPFSSGISSSFGHTLQGNVNKSDIDMSPSSLGSQPSTSFQQKAIGKNKLFQYPIDGGRVGSSSVNIGPYSVDSKEALTSAWRFKSNYLHVKQKPRQGQKLGLKSSSKIIERKFFCCVCGMGFTNSGNKSRHERTTCGMSKYTCNLCNAVFTRSDSKSRHMLASHGIYMSLKG